MSSEPKQPWFPAKTIGYGWGAPRCWQGWAVIAVFLAAMVLGAVVLRPAVHPGYSIAWCLLLSAALTIVCWLKGEKPSRSSTRK
jgi:hypothetical protein